MQTHTVDRWRLAGWFALVGVWAASFIYMASPARGTVLCIFRRITDLSCPGCGLTRSFCAMSDLDPVGAFSAHLAGPSLYLAMVWMIAVGALRVGLRRPGVGQVPFLAVRVYWGIAGGLYVAQTARVMSTW